MAVTPGILYIISAPSGAGKSSLMRALLASKELGDLSLSISHTTRDQRPGEVDGEHYYFVDAANFAAMVARHEFIEHAKVFSHYYGTARSIVEQALIRGSDIFLEIDWQGARQVREKMVDVRTIFILPPSRKALEQRLRLRGQDSEAVIVRRMEAAMQELAHYQEYDYLIVNDDFRQALTELKAIVCATRLQRPYQQSRCQALLGKLLATSS